MKQIRRIGLGILLFFMFTAVSTLAEIKIGIFDMTKFQQKSLVIKKKREVIEKKFTPSKQKVDQEVENLKKMESDIQKKKSVLSADALNDMILEIEAKRRLVKFLGEDFNETLKAAEMDAAKDVEKDLSEIIKNLAKKEAFTIVFDKRTMGLLWTEGAVDITDKVLETYDKTSKP
jgi:outer membrane protein